MKGRKKILSQIYNLFSLESKVTYTKTGTEAVKIKATGIEILNDEEFEEFKTSPNYQENLYKPDLRGL